MDERIKHKRPVAESWKRFLEHYDLLHKEDGGVFQFETGSAIFNTELGLIVVDETGTITEPEDLAPLTDLSGDPAFVMSGDEVDLWGITTYGYWPEGEPPLYQSMYGDETWCKCDYCGSLWLLTESSDVWEMPCGCITEEYEFDYGMPYGCSPRSITHELNFIPDDVNAYWMQLRLPQVHFDMDKLAQEIRVLHALRRRVSTNWHELAEGPFLGMLNTARYVLFDPFKKDRGPASLRMLSYAGRLAGLKDADRKRWIRTAREYEVTTRHCGELIKQLTVKAKEGNAA